MPTMTLLLSSILWNAALATALAVVVGGISCGGIVKQRPGLRCLLWMLVLLKLVTPPVVPLPLLPRGWLEESRTGAVIVPASHSPEDVVLATTTLQPSLSDSAPSSARGVVTWPLVAVGLSAAGTLALLAISALQTLRLSTALQIGHANDPRLRRIAAESSRRMGMTTAPLVHVVSANISPLLWIRSAGPIVVLPRHVVQEFSDQQLTWVVSHEIAHYSRRDHWANLLTLLVAALFWWHPVVWWARREIRLAQDLCCDSLAIDATAAPRRQYAEALYQILEFIHAERPLSLALASRFGGKPSAQRRFEMIADRNLSHRLSWWSWPMLLAGVAFLPCVPTFARADAINLSDCPDAVRKTIQQEADDGKIVEVEKESRKGATIYEATVAVDKREYEVRIAKNGTLLSKLLEGKGGLNADKSDGKDDEDKDDGDKDDGDKDDGDKDDGDKDDKDKDADDRAEKGADGDDDKDAKDSEDKDTKDADKKAADKDDDDKDDDAKDKDDKDDGDKDNGDKDSKRDNDKDADRDDAEAPVKLSDLPEAVRKTLKREARGGKIEDTVRDRERGKTVYEADLELGERDYELKIAESGVLISKVLIDDEKHGDDGNGDEDKDDDKGNNKDEKEDRDDASKK